MNKLFSKQSIGAWCRRGAWLVVVFGLIQIAGIWISRSTAAPFLAPGSGVLQPYYFVILILQPILAVFTYTLFYFFVLYAIGIACDHFFGVAALRRPAAPLAVEDEVLEEPLLRE